jgi:phosphoribosyl 1,2-cyclic phosphodiesterase
LNIKVIGSGSSGNCYKVSDGKTSLLLECGLPIKKIKEGCDFDLSNIAGCLVTHEHQDHCKSVNDVMKAGIDVYCSLGSWEKINYNRNYQRRSFGLPLNSNYFDKIYEPFTVGTFRIKPFSTEHDAAEPVGYLIYSKITGETLLFATDTYYLRNKFPNLNYIMIEANYSNESIQDAENKNRLRRSHMSIENCIEMLKANDLSHVKEIWLLHLSSSNGNAEEFKRMVQEASGCEVHIA